MSAPDLRFLTILTARLDNAQILGDTPEGERKIVPVRGGDVEGPRLTGKILAGGGDWARTTRNGVLHLDVRLTVETNDHALIYIQYTGLRHGLPKVMAALARGERIDPNEVYFRIQPRFETSDPRYDWLNKILCVGTGERLSDGPRYHIYEVV